MTVEVFLLLSLALAVCVYAVVLGYVVALNVLERRPALVEVKSIYEVNPK